MMARLLDRFNTRPVGFRIDETMEGSHEFVEGSGPPGRHPFSFSVTWGPDHLRGYLDPRADTFLTQSMQGTVTIGGLTESAPCVGTLELRYFKDQTIRYTFEFAIEGTWYRFLGEKVSIYPWNLLFSHTTCFGVLLEKATGKLISRSVTHFRFRAIPRFLASIRLVR